MRIRWRLALYGGLVASVTMFIFSVLLSGLVQRTAPERQIEELSVVAATVAEQVAAAPGDAIRAQIPLTAVDPAVSTDAFQVVFDADGAVMFSTVEADATDLFFALEEEALSAGSATAILTIDGAEVQFVARPWVNPDEGTRGLLAIGQSTAAVEQQLEQLGGVLFLAGLLTLLVSLVVGWFVGKRALRPLRKLASTADTIAETGDLSQRLPAVRHRDEVGALTESFNGMLDRLEDARARLGQSLDTQRRFVADASHELRSPLTTIRNNAGFLLDRPDVSDADRRDAVGDIADEAGRMADLVDDLLTLARSDAGVVAQREPVDLVEVVESVVRHVGGGAVRLDLPERALVRGDRASLHRLVRTLVDNAAKHGGGEVDVAVTSREGAVRLAVADRGPGFPPDDIVRVFDRFYRADSSRSAEGTGLGMAIAKGIVIAHGGTILAANRAGGGAVIEADLPV